MSKQCCVTMILSQLSTAQIYEEENTPSHRLQIPQKQFVPEKQVFYTCISYIVSFSISLIFQTSFKKAETLCNKSTGLGKNKNGTSTSSFLTLHIKVMNQRQLISCAECHSTLYILLSVPSHTLFCCFPMAVYIKFCI